MNSNKYSNQCFPAAYGAAQDHENQNPIIVHGFVKSSLYYIVHAWCEVGGLVYDYTKQKNGFEKHIYYQDRGVYKKHLVRYTLDEYISLVKKYNNDGPFDEVLCKVPDLLIYEPLKVFELILLEESNQTEKLNEMERKLLDSE